MCDFTWKKGKKRCQREAAETLKVGYNGSSETINLCLVHSEKAKKWFGRKGVTVELIGR